ncbi:hypothetical protein SGPA1_11481 [Streptomyces misionensis JCM 4497]
MASTGGRAEEARRDRLRGRRRPGHAHVGVLRDQPRRSARDAGRAAPGAARFPRAGAGTDRRP